MFNHALNYPKIYQNNLLRVFSGSVAQRQGGSPVWRFLLLIIISVVSSIAYANSDNSADTTNQAAQKKSARTLQVVITSLPPYVTKTSNGKLQGIEGNMFDMAAKKLGFKYKVTVTNWNGMLASVQSGRADIAVSDVAWTKARARTGLFTNPTHYLSELIAERNELNIHTINQLKGHTVGAINGQSYVDPLNSLSRVDLRLYPDSVAMLSDLSSGRIDVAFMDPLVMVHEKNVRPNMDFKVVPFSPPSIKKVAKHPKWGLFGPQMVGWYVNPDEKQLVERLNRVIHQFWEKGVNGAQISAIGVDNLQPFLSPSPKWIHYFEQLRRGVDRPKDWNAPTEQNIAGD